LLQTVFRFKSPQKQSPKPVLASPLVHQFSINYFDEMYRFLLALILSKQTPMNILQMNK
jgi:hypothetical protein